MASIDISTALNLSSIITKDNEIGNRADKAVQAGMFMVEKAYVKEVPRDKGDFSQGLQVQRNSFLDYVVKSTAKKKGRNYPLDLYMGTGKMRGKPDFGYTTGHVRAGTVAYGIGGVRPNKAAARAKKKVEKNYINFIKNKIDLD